METWRAKNETNPLKADPRTSKKHLLTTFVALALLVGCAKTIYPETEPHATFVVDGLVMRVEVSPYVNAMPGSTSNDLIIPIQFSLVEFDSPTDWPRKFKITQIRLETLKGTITQLSALDHIQWMHPSLPESSNTLRIPLSKADRYIHTLSLWFKDDTGKRYLVSFHRLYGGDVH